MYFSCFSEFEHHEKLTAIKHDLHRECNLTIDADILSKDIDIVIQDKTEIGKGNLKLFFGPPQIGFNTAQYPSPPQKAYDIITSYGFVLIHQARDRWVFTHIR
jgi:hypothetical protein